MATPKKYLHDRLILLLLSINAFLAVLTSILILLRLDPGRSTGYIIQYRSQLSLVDAFKTGSSGALIGFIVFSMLVMVFHTYLSIRAYHVRRHFSVAILALGLLLLVLSLIVSNALLQL